MSAPEIDYAALTVQVTKPRSGAARGLAEAGLQVMPIAEDEGDVDRYVFSKRLAVDRRTGNGFVNGIMDKSLFTSAIYLREHGRFPEAEAQYLQALAVRENHADTHRNIGVLYDLYLGDRERALQHFYRYQALSDEDTRRVSGWIADLERQPTLLVQGGLDHD